LIVDFGVGTTEQVASLYEAPFQHLVEFVKRVRVKNNRKVRAQNWWRLGETLPAFRKAIENLPRYLATARVAKHRLFVWLDSTVLPDSKVIAIAFADDFRFGIVQSRIHEAWTLATCGWHGKGNDATYNPTECFETFPFPRSTPAQKTSIADAAKELNELRERWLNPPEWTEERILEFPGSMNGPWARYVVNADKNGVGTVRYPRLEPRDADCAAKLKKRTLTNLYNERPAWLDLAHKKLDSAVAAAYGWPTDLTNEQILERLLALNLQRAAEEESRAKAKKPKASREKRADELI
jgi:type II restriction/modification system DNA methylase subunit YeeA